MMKNNMHYFKITLILAVPIAVFIIVLGLFELDYSSWSSVLKLLGKGLFVGVFTAIILGIINMFTKVDTFLKKE
jgi:hypothetical protein